MAKKAQPAPASPKPYDVLAMRLQRAINTHAAQKSNGQPAGLREGLTVTRADTDHRLTKFQLVQQKKS